MSDHELNKVLCEDDVHHLFGLTYASYFVAPRSVLQSMPADWQHRFAELVDEMQELYGGYDMEYKVLAVDEKQRFKSDPLRNYERGRRFVQPKPFTFNQPENTDGR